MTAKSSHGSAGRVVLYTRVSALMGRSGDDFHSPDMQAEAMRRASTTAGLREVGLVEDIDVSGQTFSRKGIDRICAMVEQRQVDVVAVYDLSRLGRNLAEALTFVKWLRAHNVSVMSTQERIDDTPEGQYMLGQFLGLAELYGAQIGRRWAEIIARRARRGQTHGPPPLGYIRAERGLAIDPTVGPAVTDVFTAYARGELISTITRTFAAARGSPTARHTIKAMLRNQVYRGRVIVGSKIAGQIDLPGQHEPLVDEDTWQRVRIRLDADSITPARHLAPGYALTGLMECAHCGRALQISVSRELDQGSGQRLQVRRFACGYSLATGACDGIGRPRYQPVEDTVLGHVSLYAHYLRDGRPVQDRRRLGDRKAVSVERELDRTRSAMARLTERWARGGLPDAAYETALDRLRASEEEQSAQLAAVVTPTAEPSPTVMLELADRLLGLWPDLEPPERNVALRSVVARVRIRRGEFWREPVPDRITDIEFKWSYGFMPGL